MGTGGGKSIEFADLKRGLIIGKEDQSFLPN